MSKLKLSSFAFKRVFHLPQATPDVLQVKAKSIKKSTVLTDTTEKNATEEEKEMFTKKKKNQPIQKVIKEMRTVWERP